MSRMENKLNLHQLQIFRTVAKHSSFSRAADELIISQPAISIYVKQLEKTVGTPLFEKVGRQVFLTEAGHCLNDYCERILLYCGKRSRPWKLSKPVKMVRCVWPQIPRPGCMWSLATLVFFAELIPR
ncbi:LysR family transcriptional regulator [Desulforamulus profundi]|uniref:LysR family transcriptional regulator n=1 Tax=Desulforamulus profundi TaxID=1383067 RepID=UPI001EE53D91|nr:LysR family transcriptional regulator [Desulforamulus profundi]